MSDFKKKDGGAFYHWSKPSLIDYCIGANKMIDQQQATITNLLKENARLKVEIADLEQDGEPYPYM